METGSAPVFIFWALSGETLILLHGNNPGADQSEDPLTD